MKLKTIDEYRMYQTELNSRKVRHSIWNSKTDNYNCITDNFQFIQLETFSFWCNTFFVTLNIPFMTQSFKKSYNNI